MNYMTERSFKSERHLHDLQRLQNKAKKNAKEKFRILLVLQSDKNVTGFGLCLCACSVVFII